MSSTHDLIQRCNDLKSEMAYLRAQAMQSMAYSGREHAQDEKIDRLSQAYSKCESSLIKAEQELNNYFTQAEE